MVNKLNDETFTFKCGRWLAKDELDHQTEVEIKVEEPNNKNDIQEKSIFKLRFNDQTFINMKF